MLCNPKSNYPAIIDDMTFFQDVKLQNKDIMEQYEMLISSGNYTDANEYVDKQGGVFMYSADFFNLIENRIYATQSHLLSKSKKKPFTYSNTTPKNPILNMIWI